MGYILDFLSDEELIKFIQNCDYGVLLDPLKKNSAKYRRYDSRLGKKDKRSVLVKRNLPDIVVQLFRNKDEAYVQILESFAETHTKEFVRNIGQLLDKEEISEDIIKSFSNEELAECINSYIAASDSKFDKKWFCIQMKFIGCEDIDSRVADILSLCDGDMEENQPGTEDEKAEGHSDENTKDNSKPEVNKRQITPGKAKRKKLTPQEKAAKTKEAEEKKKAELERTVQKENVIETDEEDDKEDDIDENGVGEDMVDENSVGESSVGEGSETDLEKKDTVQTLIQEKTDSKKEKNKMTAYIGEIRIVERGINAFYNFTPIGKYENDVYTPLLESEIEELLPVSIRHNVNFYYKFNSPEQDSFMRKHFRDEKPIAFCFETGELEETYSPNNETIPTGYRYGAFKGYEEGKIIDLSKLGLYKLLTPDSIKEEIGSKRNVRIECDDIVEGQEVMISIKKGFYAGPFEVMMHKNYYTETEMYYLVLPDVESKHYVMGYKVEDCQRKRVEASFEVENLLGCDSWDYYSIKKGANPVPIDLITDKELLLSFKEALEADEEISGADFDAVEVVERIGGSQIAGDSLPEEIKQLRKDRIRKILTEEEELNQFYEEASELVFGLLLNNKDQVRTDELIAGVIDQNPELLMKFQGMRSVQAKIEEARADLEDLNALKERTEGEIQAAETKSQEEAKNAELSKEIEEREKELQSLKDKIKTAEEALTLQEKIDVLIENEKYYKKHIENLRKDTDQLESKFVNMVTNYSERMTDIIFDGYMSSKMLKAAASWENDNDQKNLDEKVETLNALESDLSGKEELIYYIISCMKTVRPNYSRNDIMNIMVCVVQGFLTVFSGLPGCGKTSICNIVSKILGLEEYGKTKE
ncbi:MAG: hypothetical protein K5656_11480, partial [Lachnospiraceae bacterium]|nr:hypothetical protein [Lachnospiraceae bacterium]